MHPRSRGHAVLPTGPGSWRFHQVLFGVGVPVGVLADFDVHIDDRLPPPAAGGRSSKDAWRRARELSDAGAAWRKRSKASTEGRVRRSVGGGARGVRLRPRVRVRLQLPLVMLGLVFCLRPPNSRCFERVRVSTKTRAARRCKSARDNAIMV